MKVIITDQVHPELLNLLVENGISYEIDLKKDETELLKNIIDFDGMIVRNRIKIDKYFLSNSKNLKFIARYGSGMESIDLKTAEQFNIKCFNSAQGNANSVAEHITGMLLSLFHNISKSNNNLKKLIWEREQYRGIELENKKIGIIGYGNTGKSFTEKLKGFNCSIMVYDKYKNGFGNSIIKESTMIDILAQADILSLHIPLNSETEYFINDSIIDNMKNPFYLINSSRGKIVSNNSLVKGLKSKKILGACLDVLENENPEFSNIKTDDNLNYLLNCNNVLITPHIAGLSAESNLKLSKILIEKILKLK
ncbi:MAG: hydroxyacid dehydrogenase [Flavobacteriales bacterium]|nr:hydroxyacid dehydrogenase [Flavobacteriales bacterium]|tara:strand:+ start:732 stop:1658 length:927 start_codon:yes stop_codon:yes gene_type:complete